VGFEGKSMKAAGWRNLKRVVGETSLYTFENTQFSEKSFFYLPEMRGGDLK
jgi:hypothetical protein